MKSKIIIIYNFYFIFVFKFKIPKFSKNYILILFCLEWEIKYSQEHMKESINRKLNNSGLVFEYLTSIFIFQIYK